MVESVNTFNNLATAQSAALKAIVAASRTIQLYAGLVDPALFNSEASVTALSHFARSSRVALLQVLIDDHKLFAVRNPSFLDLAQRLTAHIEIRSVPFEIRNGNDCYLVSDQCSIWYMPDRNILSGSYQKEDRVKANKLSESFQYFWERSKQPEDYRQLGF